VVEAVPLRRLIETVASGAADLGGIDAPLIVVDLDAPCEVSGTLGTVPAVVVGLSHQPSPWVDAVVDDVALEAVAANVNRRPRAAIALALLLRGQAERTIGEGLVAESATYSTLQAGPEFAAWRASRQPRPVQLRDNPAVRVTRDGDELHITLSRPEVHNAMNTQMRDELFDAFMLARADPSVRVHVDGDGPSFCAGGDLDEFGARPDPATAHVVRLQRSIGGLITSMADRVEVALHGASLGSGIELPAFAARVVADPATAIGLPELGLGLIPGAGGTVSITRRIGRHRTAWLALTGETIDARTALDWGLIDDITP
jgi:enoyl-CoA hydratase/carnithine racemase